ncbi:aldehyde dehydrogenase family protein [Alkalilimnicola ehrlichii MLHE-1]|uniref:Aldehyde dehydrogenase n=1 Tax=Alkalilimnicola ehrlichii (strain ATCC BAA-1101 / DSM 17681 / MLHE-1) TaxID=187272 RepID=Q0A636_ALKEH|nr:aldehyde dehydrogenase family protein [Alkalilimnicola ehrlichii]ABI57701.1 aldehyde dehydrogenase [Alkalilimnicola ehrlichii MLHE-1]
MRAALLLVDWQQDYLDRGVDAAEAGAAIRQARTLLDGFRRRSLPVCHVRTLIAADGHNRMPHWQRRAHWACVGGTPGAAPPPALAEAPGEAVLAKPYYSAFGGAGTAAWLGEQGVDTVVVSGLHTHACVQATVLDAYQAGFQVWLAVDAVASYDPLHARLALRHLADRACAALTTADIRARLGEPDDGGAATRRPTPGRDLQPAACIAGQWHRAAAPEQLTRHDPCDHRRILSRTGAADAPLVGAAVEAARAAGAGWAALPDSQRIAMLKAWEARLQQQRHELVAALIREVGKPSLEAGAEFDYALALLATSLEPMAPTPPGALAPGVSVRHRPRGVVAAITPWNNPLALPLGKIGPALRWGNSVVWKPAPEAPELARMLMQTGLDAGLPPGVLNLVQGGAATGDTLAADARVQAVSFTGSITAGRQVAAACALHGTPLQAELGGNNAALVMADADPERAAGELARAAFSFAGQRCTAVRRLLVASSVLDRFTEAFLARVQALRPGRPEAPDTVVGPLVSRAAQARIEGIVARARAAGANVLCGGRVPPAWAQGNWYAPTVLTGLPPDAECMQQESFGPVVVLVPVADLDEALDRLNGVPQGLAATLYSNDPAVQRRFLAQAQAGLLRLNGAGAAIDPRAPFGGWKASAIGPPEHGVWDPLFYTRAQAVYAPPDDPGPGDDAH